MRNGNVRKAVCGLDCDACDLLLLPTNESAQKRILPWFRERGWIAGDEGLEVVLSKGMYCRGCGDEHVCWSHDCAMLACCRGRGFANCSECGEFPCELLRNHGEASPRYREGVEYLARLRPSAK